MNRAALIYLLISLGLLALLSGCATTNEDSDLPWNMPQNWEGSPYIPGLNEGR